MSGVLVVGIDDLVLFHCFSEAALRRCHPFGSPLDMCGCILRTVASVVPSVVPLAHSGVGNVFVRCFNIACFIYEKAALFV